MKRKKKGKRKKFSLRRPTLFRAFIKEQGVEEKKKRKKRGGERGEAWVRPNPPFTSCGRKKKGKKENFKGKSPVMMGGQRRTKKRKGGWGKGGRRPAATNAGYGKREKKRKTLRKDGERKGQRGGAGVFRKKFGRMGGGKKKKKKRGEGDWTSVNCFAEGGGGGKKKEKKGTRPPTKALAYLRGGCMWKKGVGTKKGGKKTRERRAVLVSWRISWKVKKRKGEIRGRGGV